MLTQLRFRNFRCFDDHMLPLRELTVIVGKNNAGKSTAVEGLRIVALAAGRILNLPFKAPPDWTGLPLRETGATPSLDGLDFNTSNVFHRYGSPPASVSATYESGAELTVYLGADTRAFAVLRDAQRRVVKTRSDAKDVLTERVEIMPQVAPVEKEEFVLGSDYVRRSLSSTLAPRHFRNQIHLLGDRYQRFCDLAEQTWAGLHIQDVSTDGPQGRQVLSLMVRNDDFIAEVSNMGHGLQMWLQTMWFLARTDDRATVILDEPDVYMHPDLQRRLIRHLRQSRRQVVVTTHSVEIMSEVLPENILVLDRRSAQSTFAASFPAAQKILDQVGSAHNLQLARLWHAKRSLLVEGNDFRLLSEFFDVLFPDDPDGLAIVPHMSIGGWTGFQYALGSSMFLSNAGGDQIAVYCLLDADYHTPKQKAARMAQAIAHKVRLHIWQRKELENYLLDPRAIRRAMEANSAKRVLLPKVDEITARLEEIASSLRDDVFDAFSSEYLLDDKRAGNQTANREARTYVNGKWTTLDTRLALTSGKRVLQLLGTWAQSEFGVSLTPALIARSFLPAEIPAEMKTVLTAIAAADVFPAT